MIALLTAAAATVVGKVILSTAIGTSISIGVKSMAGYFSRKSAADKAEEERSLREQIR